MKRLTVVMALAGLLVLPSVAKAEITWTDMGGDIYMLYFYSNNVLDFDDDDGSFLGFDDQGDLFRTEVHLNFKADLDDNVSVGVSLEADRDLESISGDNAGANSFDSGVTDLAVFIEEAYVKIAEPFDLPITVTGGRFFANWGDDSTAEDFNGYWGDGMVLGDGDPITPGSLYTLGDWETDPFDGVVVSFDYDTFVVDAFWLLATDQNDFGDRSTDTEALGFYASYLGVEGMQFDGYVIWTTSDGDSANAILVNNSDQFTLGARVAGALLDDQIAYKLEGAYQLGDQDGFFGGPDGDFEAWAVEAGVNWHPDHDLNPEIGFVYTLQSGDDDVADGDYGYWAPAFENKGYGMIADAFVWTNAHIFHVDAGIDLMEDLRLETDWYYYLLQEEDGGILNLGADAFNFPVGPADDEQLGWEIDAQVNYTFSENVDAFFGGGVFIPEQAVEDVLGVDDEAYFVRTGVKVAF